MKNKKILSLLMATPLIVGCTVTTLIAQESNIEGQNRNVSEFTGVLKEGPIDVFVSVGNSFSVTVNAENEEDLEKLITEVHNGVLEIYMDDDDRDRRRSWRDHDAIREVFISMPSIRKISGEGSGSLEVKGMDSKKIEIDQSGSGPIYINGKCGSMDLDKSGSGEFTAEGISCDNVSVDKSGSGVINMSGTCKTVEYDISGSGGVRAADFKCDESEVDFSGSGRSQVFGTYKMEIDFSGNGTLKLSSRPEKLKLRKSGNGQIEFPN